MRTREFERLYAEHAAAVIGFLAYRVGDRHVAEDLAADTFERVYKARRRFDPRRASEKTWIYAIALNCLRSHLRQAESARLAQTRAPATAPAEPDDALEQVEHRDLLRRSLHVLSDVEREVFALRYGADLSVPEIARLTGSSRTTVEGRLYGGLRKLRQEVQAADAIADHPAQIPER